MQRTRFDWRHLTALALGTAAQLRTAGLRQPLVPVAEIVADPEQIAADHILAAYRALKEGDAAATPSQLFSRLRLMFNKLEHGGLRQAPPAQRPPAQVLTDTAVSQQVFEQDWFGRLRNRSRSLRGALQRLTD